MQDIQPEAISFSRPAVMTGRKRYGLGCKSLCLKHACVPEVASIFYSSSKKRYHLVAQKICFT